MALVFQYGSNATAGRLNSPNRLSGRAKDLGRAQTVGDFDIAFDVFSRTNGCAAADLVATPGRKAWGVLYEVADVDVRGALPHRQKTLTDIEGPRYEEMPIQVRDKDEVERTAITFVVKVKDRQTGLATSGAYVSWIVYGLRDHGVPEEYLRHVIEVATAVNSGAGAVEQTRLIETL